MYRFFVRILFVISFCTGILFGVLYSYLSVQKCDTNSDYTKAPTNANYSKWFAAKGLRRQKVPLDDLRYGTRKHYSESQYLFDNVDIFCVILVRNKKNAIAANNTWAQNCNKVEFIYTFNGNEKRKMIPTKKTKENSSWTILCRGLQKLPSTSHWYFVLNDSTFAVLENLRLILASLNPNKGHYIGHAVKFWGTTYNMGQAGYVLSKKTLNILKSRLENTSCIADITYMNQEDLYLGKIQLVNFLLRCTFVFVGKVLSTFNITPIDTRDSQGLTTFHSFNWQHEFFPNINYYKFSIYPVVCCSIQSVTFQVS